MENYIRGNIKFNKTTIQFYVYTVLPFLYIILFSNKIFDAYYYYGIYSSEMVNYMLGILLIGGFFTISLLSFSNQNHFYTFNENNMIIESAVLKKKICLEYNKIKYITILKNQSEVIIKIDYYFIKNRVKKYYLTSANLSGDDALKFESNCQSNKINYHYNPNYLA